MKKILLSSLLFTVCVASTNANCVFQTSCGKQGMTVGLDFFNGDKRAFNEYLQELNYAMCGEYGIVRILRDDSKPTDNDAK